MTEPVVPGEVILADTSVELGAGRGRVALTVVNSGDRPIQIGSHYHFAGASIALGRSGQPPSRMRSVLRVGEGASLTGETGALIVSHGSSACVGVDLSLAPGSHVDWTELIVLGRDGESGGHARLRWNAVVGARPLLRQTLDLRSLGGSTTGGHRVIASTLLVTPDRPLRTVVLRPTAVAARLNEHAALLTVLADYTARARNELYGLRDALRRRDEQPRQWIA